MNAEVVPRLSMILVITTLLLLTTVSCQNYGNKFSLSEKVCSASTCRLPNCRCATRSGPSNIATKDLPQIVMVTFDDAVNKENIHHYRRLFPGNFTRRNPNGCPIAATFFVSHKWTDYKMVRQLYLYGHEIADHSISHRLPNDWWRKATYKEWYGEIVGQRRNIAKKAGVPKSEVRGVRVPFLEIGSDTQFEVLMDNDFEYDASFLSGPYNDRDWRQPAWPYTLDYYPTLEYCDSHYCPKTNFSGFWEVPLNRWLGLDGKSCPMIDGCTTQSLRDKREVLRYFWKNFNRHYKKNRAPFGINMHATWFDKEYKLAAMEEFLDDILENKKVYIVTVHQAIEWMRKPTSLRKIRTFAPWVTCKNKRLLVQRRKVTRPTSKVHPTSTSAPERSRKKTKEKTITKLEKPTRGNKSPETKSQEIKTKRPRSTTEVPKNGILTSTKESKERAKHHSRPPKVQKESKGKAEKRNVKNTSDMKTVKKVAVDGSGEQQKVRGSQRPTRTGVSSGRRDVSSAADGWPRLPSTLLFILITGATLKAFWSTTGHI